MIENLTVTFGPSPLPAVRPTDPSRFDFSLAAQGAREDVANAVSMLDEVGRTGRHMDFRTFNRAMQLLQSALTKMAPR